MVNDVEDRVARVEERTAVIETRVMNALDLLQEHMRRDDVTTAATLAELTRVRMEGGKAVDALREVQKEDSRNTQAALYTMTESLSRIHIKISNWHGVAAGVALAVSAGWALLLFAFAVWK